MCWFMLNNENGYTCWKVYITEVIIWYYYELWKGSWYIYIYIWRMTGIWHDPRMSLNDCDNESRRTYEKCEMVSLINKENYCDCWDNMICYVIWRVWLLYVLNCYDMEMITERKWLLFLMKDVKCYEHW